MLLCHKELGQSTIPSPFDMSSTAAQVQEQVLKHYPYAGSLAMHNLSI